MNTQKRLTKVIKVTVMMEKNRMTEGRLRESVKTQEKDITNVRDCVQRLTNERLLRDGLKSIVTYPMVWHTIIKVQLSTTF